MVDVRSRSGGTPWLCFIYRFVSLLGRSRVGFGMVLGGQNGFQNRFFGGSFSDAFFYRFFVEFLSIFGVIL